MHAFDALLPLKSSTIRGSSRLVPVKNAFTLIELAIVLVIIGLVIGGVMVGRDLIAAGEIRKQISQIRELNAAVNTFRLKYGCLPGDCINATQFFASISQPAKVTNGNGDGLIDISTSSVVAGDQNIGWAHSLAGNYYAEWGGMFDQLNASNLWSMPQYDEETTGQTTGISCPATVFRSGGNTSDVVLQILDGCMSLGYVPGYNYVKDGHKIALGAYGGSGAMGAGSSAGINPWEAEAVDTKLDDGKPYTGQAVIMNYGYIYRTPAYCANDPSNIYRNQSNIVIDGSGNPRVKTCVLYISAQF